MTQIDLKLLGKGDVRVLIGQDKGLAAREVLQLDRLDADADIITVIVPKSLRTLTPSFVQGLFAASVRRFGEVGFFQKYRFDVPTGILSDIRAGVDRVLTSRHLSGAV